MLTEVGTRFTFGESVSLSQPCFCLNVRLRDHSLITSVPEFNYQYQQFQCKPSINANVNAYVCVTLFSVGETVPVA